MTENPTDEPVTMIRLSRKTRDMLKAYGNKGESYDQVIVRMLEERGSLLRSEDSLRDEVTACREHIELLERARTSSDEQLRALIADADARIEEYKGHGEGRFYDSVLGWENDSLDVLLWSEASLSLSTPERAVLTVLINKRLAEYELQQRRAANAIA
jgi:hypothetical protein